MKFALSLTARNDIGGNIRIHNRAAYTNKARSTEDAVRIGIELARKHWPAANGWFSHNCAICPIPPNTKRKRKKNKN